MKVNGNKREIWFPPLLAGQTVHGTGMVGVDWWPLNISIWLQNDNEDFLCCSFLVCVVAVFPWLFFLFLFSFYFYFVQQKQLPLYDGWVKGADFLWWFINTVHLQKYNLDLRTNIDSRFLKIICLSLLDNNLGGQLFSTKSNKLERVSGWVQLSDILHLRWS